MRLHCEIAGSGPDLALIHGWGMHGGIWDGVRGALARVFRLHVIDLPGYGASPLADSGNLDTLATAVAAALPDNAGVCGWSLGGLVALEVARRYPEKVGRLALISATPCFTARADWPCAVRRDVLESFAAELESDYEGTMKRFLSLQVRGDDNAKAVLRHLRDSLFARGRPDGAVLREGLNILLESDMREHAAEVKAPTRLLHGDRDMLTPLGAAQWLAARMPEARLEVFSGAAHAPFLSHPVEFAEILTGFMHG